MENYTNCSNCSGANGGLVGTGFGIFFIIILLVNFFAFCLVIVATTTLCRVKSIAKILRIFLISLLQSELVVIPFNVTLATTAALLNFTTLQPPSLVVCRVALWGYNAATFARLFHLAAFSIVVLLIVRYHKRQFHTYFIVRTLPHLCMDYSSDHQSISTCSSCLQLPIF